MALDALVKLSLLPTTVTVVLAWHIMLKLEVGSLYNFVYNITGKLVHETFEFHFRCKNARWQSNRRS